MYAANLLKGRRILVTGGGTGLGKAMAEKFLDTRRRSRTSAAAASSCATIPQPS